MTNANPQGFSKSELADFYEQIILYHEVTGGLQGIKFSVRSKSFRKLLAEIELEFKRFSTLPELSKHITEQGGAKPYTKSFCWFHDSENNSLKSVLKLLRNSAAHAHIKRVKRSQIWYSITHKYKNTTKLVIEMKKTDFWRFIEQAKKSK